MEAESSPSLQPEAKKAKLSSYSSSSSSSIIEINVGGQIFSTTKNTLLAQSSNFFERLLETDNDDPSSTTNTTYTITGALRDQYGRIFIDRNPKLFEQVLEYLRNNLDVERLTNYEKEKLQKEALYYQLDGLIDILRPNSTGYDERFLSKNDIDLRQDMQSIRAKLLDNNATTLSSCTNINKRSTAEEADSLLTDLFPSSSNEDGHDASTTSSSPMTEFFQEPATSPNATILFSDHVEKARKTNDYSLPNDTQDFKERLIRFGGPLLQDLPMENIVIAGGSVLQCLQRDHTVGETTMSSDIDLFVLADTDDKAKATFQRIFLHMTNLEQRTRGGLDTQLLVTRSPHAVTFCVGNPQRHIQMILVRYQCIADVILNFDIDCCQVAWDGQRVLATPNAIRAFRTGINIADPERRGASNEYEWRLAKYARAGFLVSVPGLDITKVKEDLIQNNCFGYHQGSLRRIHLTFKEGEERPKFYPDKNGIDGLAKLIVLSTICETYFFMADTIPQMVPPLPPVVRPRLQDTNGLSGGGFLGQHSISLGTGNYLLDYRIMVTTPRFTWRLPTPPYPPPSMLQTTSKFVRAIDSSGMDILPWNASPRVLFNLLHGIDSDEPYEPRSAIPYALTEKRLICFDYFPNLHGADLGGVTCHNILDAKFQYPTYPFVTGPGLLPRFLTFASSSGPNAKPWERNSSDASWTLGVYKENPE